MNKIIDIFIAPTKVFTSLKEKPKWVIPFIIVLVVIAITATLTISMTKESILVKQEEKMRERGMTEEQIEQAKKFTTGPVMMISGAVGAVVFTTITLLIFTLVVNLFIPLFSGKGAFKNVFSVVCFSALIKVPSAILKFILIAITRSLYVTTSLALFVPNLIKESFGYKLLSGFDLFMIWEMILVSLGISITNEIKKQYAYILVFIIWVASIFIGIGFGVLIPS